MELVLALTALIVALFANSTANAARRETALLAERITPLEPEVPKPHAPAPAVDVVPAPAPPTAEPPATPVRSSERAHPTANEVESFLGGRVMLVVGLFAVLLAVGFFLRHAITIGLLGPIARLALSTMAGLAALAVGDRMRVRGVVVWGQAVMGLGIGTLFLVLWFAAKVYGFLGEPAALGLALANTAAAVLLAVRCRAPFLAHVGFVGGYLAPALLGTATGALAPLATWLLVLDLGVLLVATRPGVRGLEPMALAATILYFESWRHAGLATASVATATLGLGVLTLANLLLAIGPAGVRRARPGPLALATVLGAGLYALIVGSQLVADPGVVYGLSALGLAGFGWTSLAWLTRRVGRENLRRDAAAFHLVGLFALACAVSFLSPASFAGAALATLALGVVHIGTVRGLATFRFGGAAIFAMALGWVNLPYIDADPTRAFLNASFVQSLSIGLAAIAAGVVLRRGGYRLGAVLGTAGTWLLFPLLAVETLIATNLWFPAMSAGPSFLMSAAVSAAYAASAVVFWRGGGSVVRTTTAVPLGGAMLLALLGLIAGPQATFTLFANPTFLGGLVVLAAAGVAARFAGGHLRTTFVAAGLGLGLALLTAELYHHGELRPIFDSSRADARFVAQVAISATWAVLAAALSAVGFARRLSGLRWAAIALFTVTVGKVFLFDTAALEAVYRVGSFLTLGLTLVGASLLYHRRRPVPANAEGGMAA